MIFSTYFYKYRRFLWFVTSIAHCLIHVDHNYVESKGTSKLYLLTLHTMFIIYCHLCMYIFHFVFVYIILCVICAIYFLAVTHGCIIAMVTLINADGTEALGYVFITYKTNIDHMAHFN